MPRLGVRLMACASILAFTAALLGARATLRAPVPRVVLIVVDGLRPDLITPTTMPTLAALRAGGVTFTNTHSSIPTVTRVNATVLTTGNYPSRTGIVGNTLYVRDVDSTGTISTSDDQALMRLAQKSGRLVTVQTLGERLKTAGLQYTVITSGSAGAAFLANPTGPAGLGVTVNGTMAGGTRVSWSDSVSNTILARYGPAPSESQMRQTTGHFGPIIQWADRILRGYLLPTFAPDVLVYWITEPDDSQHAHGPGSPQALASMRESDAAIAHLIAALDSTSGGTNAVTNYLVVSDHGFAQHAEGVPVVGALVAAGLKHDARSNDVMVVSEAQAIHLYVKGHDSEKTRALVSFFQSQPWTAAIFARDSTIAGTFPLAAIHVDHPERGADLFVALAWRADTNAFGVPGLQTIAVNGAGGPITSGASGHGGVSPYTIHSTMILAGPAFQRGVTLSTPSGNVDVTPTILRLLGLPGAGVDGRVLDEALVGGPSSGSLYPRTDTIVARAGTYRSMLQVTTLGRESYVDAAWRARSP